MTPSFAQAHRVFCSVSFVTQAFKQPLYLRFLLIVRSQPYHGTLCASAPEPALRGLHREFVCSHLAFRYASGFKDPPLRSPLILLSRSIVLRQSADFGACTEKCWQQRKCHSFGLCHMAFSFSLCIIRHSSGVLPLRFGSLRSWLPSATKAPRYRSPFSLLQARHLSITHQTRLTLSSTLTFRVFPRIQGCFQSIRNPRLCFAQCVCFAGSQ